MTSALSTFQHTSPPSLLWSYLGSFALYTLLAVGFLYLVFWVIKNNPRLNTQLNHHLHRQNGFPPTPSALNSLSQGHGQKAAPPISSSIGALPGQWKLFYQRVLALLGFSGLGFNPNEAITPEQPESNCICLDGHLALDFQQSLCVVRVNNEQFLISQSPQHGITLLQTLKTFEENPSSPIKSNLEGPPRTASYSSEAIVEKTVEAVSYQTEAITP